jgi:2-polyprenyl-6-methoxyphenol hydroxylase-like FAD-dependent oxidoreductase
VNFLIVGGGPVGNSLSIFLRRNGFQVDLVEADPEWKILGSGITLQGNALRVLRELGVWPEVPANMVASDVPGRPSLGGPDLPVTGGMFRPTLQAILVEAVRISGTNVRLGVGIESYEQHRDTVTARFTDGTYGVYHLVVGADGIHSTVRRLMGVDAEIGSTGLAIWRVHAIRPASVTSAGTLHHGGPVYLSSWNPTSPTHLYGYVGEDARDRSELPVDLAAELRRITAGLPTRGRRSGNIVDPGRIDYRYFGYLLVDAPWHRSRVVLAGDAAHACPPTTAQGAATGLEDASVLAELLAGNPVEKALEAYTERRYDRVKAVAPWKSARP